MNSLYWYLDVLLQENKSLKDLETNLNSIHKKREKMPGKTGSQ